MAAARRAGGRETLDVRTGDGVSLRVDVHEPASSPVGVALLAHALMARRSEFERPVGAGVVDLLVQRGWRAITFDFRGHGDSGKTAGGSGGGYDDFVLGDLPAMCAFARSGAPRRRPLVIVGHSLGGHTSLAAQGIGAIRVDGIVAVAAAPWLPQTEPSRAMWSLKRGVFEAMAGLGAAVGRFPARALRLGSDDVSRRCAQDFLRFARSGRWGSADGRFDYLAALARVEIPVLHLVSTGDRFECAPPCGARFTDRCGGPHELVCATESDDGGPAPHHMGLVTSGKIARVWSRAESWMRSVPAA